MSTTTSTTSTITEGTKDTMGQADGATSEVPRLPGYFPLRTRACVDAADVLFQCLAREAVLDGSAEHPVVAAKHAREAPIRCKAALDLYTQCMGRFAGPRPAAPTRSRWLGFF